MKKIVSVTFLAVSMTAGAVLFSSCGTPFPLGCLYTKITLPVALGNGDIRYNRYGESECYNVLGWFAGGDGSINAAATNGQINHISWVNQRVENWFGVYGTYKTQVYGFGQQGADLTVAPIAKAE